MFIYSPAMPVILGTAAALCLLFLMTRGRKVMLIASIVFFITAFIGGLILNAFAFMPQDAGLPDVISVMLRSVYNTGRMFAGEESYDSWLSSPYGGAFTESIAAQIAFWLIHGLALVALPAAVFALVGRKAIDRVRMYLQPYRSSYIILGTDKRALTLGKNIALSDGKLTKPNRKRLVIFIDEEITDDFISQAAEFGGISLEADEDSLSKLLKSASLAVVRRRKIKLIMMPRDETRSLNLLADALGGACELKLSPERFYIYLVAESQWICKQAGDTAHKYGYPIYAAGEAGMATRTMLNSRPPWEAVSFAGMKANRPLTALILGFGAMGQEALRRLIMNGQFPGVKMKAYIVDKNMDAIKGAFKRHHPLLDDYCEIVFHSLDVTSEKYYETLDIIADEINYIVVAMDNDALNLTAAQNLREYQYQREEDASAPPIIVFLREGCPDSEEAAIGKDSGVNFVSSSANLFKESIVIHEQLDYRAMLINAKYNGAENLNNRKEIEQLWHSPDCSPFDMESSRAAADFIGGILAIAGADGDFDPESMDEDIVEQLAMAEHRRWNAFHAVMGYRRMSIDLMEKRFHNMKAEGKEIDDCTNCRKDIEKKLHACLTAWDELDVVKDRYNALMEEGDIAGKKGKLKDFKKSDRDNIMILSMVIKADT